MYHRRGRDRDRERDRGGERAGGDGDSRGNYYGRRGSSHQVGGGRSGRRDDGGGGRDHYTQQDRGEGRGGRDYDDGSRRSGGSSYHSHHRGDGEKHSSGNSDRLNRDISSSRERSRERERRRRRAQAECIARAGGFQKLADSEGREPVRLFWDGFQWVAKTGHSQTLQNDPALMNSTRKMRRLYFGNLPLHLGLTETAFQDVVWQEMRTRGFCNNPDENPVLYVWFAKDKGNYGFAEFASVEETERALSMDGMTCMGVPLKVSRPNDYTTTGPVPPPGTPAQPSSAAHATLNPMAMMGQQAAAQMLMAGGAAPAPSNGTPTLPTTAVSTPTPGPPPGLPPGTTKCVKLVQVVRPESIQSDDEFQEILEDVEEGCRRHGMITFSHIIRRSDLPVAPAGTNVADVFLEYSNSAQADECLRLMAGRKYEGRALGIVRVPESVMEEVIKGKMRAGKHGAEKEDDESGGWEDEEAAAEPAHRGESLREEEDDYRYRRHDERGRNGSGGDESEAQFDRYDGSTNSADSANAAGGPSL